MYISQIAAAIWQSTELLYIVHCCNGLFSVSASSEWTHLLSSLITTQAYPGQILLFAQMHEQFL